MGIPYRKVGRVLSKGFGLGVCPGGLARSGQRLTRQAKPTYAQMILQLRESKVVNGDETGWKIDGEKAWLWVFTSEAVTVYVIDPTRAHEVADRVLGEEFEGVLGCDCFPAYDPLEYQQQKCLGHLLRRCSRIALVQGDEAVAFSQQVARLLRRAMQLKKRRTEMSPHGYLVNKRRTEMSPHGYLVARGKVEATLDRLLNQEVSDPENVKLVKLLTKQRHRLLTFLYIEEVDPTNNIAERRIRPAVIVRKISAGNRSDRGSETHATLTSIVQTCRQQEKDFLDVATRLLRSPQPRALNLMAEKREDESTQLGYSAAQPRAP
jgi:transposase